MLNNRKGQAFVEAVFVFPIMVVLIFSVIWFAKVCLTWQQLISATRYGTDLIANTTLSAEDIKRDIENYLTHRMIEGRRLDINKIKEIKIDIKRYSGINYDILDMSNYLNIAKSFVDNPSNELSTVSISYLYGLPKLMKFIGLEQFEIKTNLSVLAGSGCNSNIHKNKK